MSNKMKLLNKKLALALKKRKLTNIIMKSNKIVHKFIILQLIYDEILNNQILLLSKKKIYINSSSLIKKGYIVEREHYIYILDNFISYFLNIFTNTYLINDALPLCLDNEYINSFISNRYLYDNENIDYYTHNYNLMIVNNFYNNCLKLQKELKKEFKESKLMLRKVNLQDNKSLYRLIQLLEEICFINKGNYGILTLFKNMEKDDNNDYDFYLIQWQILFSNYLNNKKLISEYRKFKKNNNII